MFSIILIAAILFNIVNCFIPESLTIICDNYSFSKSNGRYINENNSTFLSWNKDCLSSVNDMTYFSDNTQLFTLTSDTRNGHYTDTQSNLIDGCIIAFNFNPKPQYVDTFFYPFIDGYESVDYSQYGFYSSDSLSNNDEDDNEDENENAGSSGDEAGSSGDEDEIMNYKYNTRKLKFFEDKPNIFRKLKSINNNPLTSNGKNFMTVFCKDRLFNSSIFYPETTTFIISENTKDNGIIPIATIFNGINETWKSISNGGKYNIQYFQNVSDIFTKTIIAHMIYLKSSQEIENYVAGCSIGAGMLIIGIPVIFGVAIIILIIFIIIRYKRKYKKLGNEMNIFIN
jgi:hypothetical protein